ncbi:MAG: hypothetical protein V3S66_10680, partial [Desulfobacterales bacterium]
SYYNWLFYNHRKDAETAERIIILQLPLRRRQMQTIMPSASCWQLNPARRAWVYFFSPFSAKRNKKNTSVPSVPLMSEASGR